MRHFKQILTATLAACLTASLGLSFLPVETISTKAEEQISTQPLQEADNGPSYLGKKPDTPYLYNFATDYFTHLDANTAYNIDGSCGYVAISCWLSFYDTFWNDNLIPESYDQPSTSLDVSPGVKDESVFESMSVEDFFYLFTANDYNNSYVDTYFQLLLYKLIQQKGEETGQNYIYLYTNEDGILEISNGVNYGKMQLIINTYLFDYLNLTSDDCVLKTISYEDGESESEGKEEVKDFAVHYVQQGYPVIVGIPNHVTVAYDYNESTDTLYGYWGHRTEEMHSPYTDFSDAYAIVLSMDHVHSDNYILNGVETCSCQLDSHQHDFSYRCEYYSVTNHREYCYCGAYQTRSHNFTHSYESSGVYHKEYCICGAHQIMEHDYTHRYQPFKAFAHKSFCVCGDFKLEDHIYFADDIHTTPQGDVYANCTYCRYHIDLPDDNNPAIINRLPQTPEELISYVESQSAQTHCLSIGESS